MDSEVGLGGRDLVIAEGSRSDAAIEQCFLFFGKSGQGILQALTWCIA